MGCCPLEQPVNLQAGNRKYRQLHGLLAFDCLSNYGSEQGDQRGTGHGRTWKRETT